MTSYTKCAVAMASALSGVYVAYKLGMNADYATILAGCMVGSIAGEMPFARNISNHVREAAFNAALGKTPRSEKTLDDLTFE